MRAMIPNLISAITGVACLLVAAELSEKGKTHTPWEVQRGVLTGLFEPAIWSTALISAFWAQVVPFIVGIAMFSLAGTSINAQQTLVVALSNGAAALAASAFKPLLSPFSTLLHLIAAVAFASMAYLQVARWWMGAGAVLRWDQPSTWFSTTPTWPLVKELSRVPIELMIAVPLAARTAASRGLGAVGFSIILMSTTVATATAIAAGAVVGKEYIVPKLEKLNGAGLAVPPGLIATSVLVVLAAYEMHRSRSHS